MTDRQFEPRHVRMKRGRDALKARVVELEAENTRLKRALELTRWPSVTIDYTNYKGERKLYDIQATGRIVSDPQYHPTIPFAIEALDVDRNLIRNFDPWAIHRWGKTVLDPRSKP